MPFAETLGLEIESAGADRVVGRVAWAPERCTAGGVLHGGYLMAAADSVGAVCAFLNLSDGSTTSTIESKTNFLRPVRAGNVTVTAIPVHVGRTIIVVQTDCVRADGKLAARTVQSQAITPVP